MSSAQKVDIWMPVHIGDIMAETMHLPRDMTGAYLLLLFAYWRRGGPLPDDAEELSTIAKASPEEWANRIAPKMRPLFVMEHALWRHVRTDAELEKAGRNKAVAIDKAKKAAEARWGKRTPGSPSGNAPSMPGAQPAGCSAHTPSPSPSPYVGGKPPTTPGAGAPVGEGEKGTPGGMPAAPAPSPPAPAPTVKPRIELADRALQLPEWLAPHAHAWAEFEQNRWAKHGRAPYTRAAQKGIVSKLEKLRDEGQDLTEVLMASVRAGWADVFAPRSQVSNARSRPAESYRERDARIAADRVAELAPRVAAHRTITLEEVDVLAVASR